MGINFKETATLKTDLNKFDYNYSKIDWSGTKQSLNEVMPKKKDHECTYSRSMNQEYPRKCVICGEVEPEKE